MKKEVIIINLSLILSLASLLAFSQENIGNPPGDLKENYLPGQILDGWINISLNQESNLNLRYNNQEISLLDFLRKNSAYFSCEPSSCNSTYEVTGSGEDTISFNLNHGAEKILGIRVDGIISGISYVGFNLTSNATANCKNQIELDVLNDGVIDVINTKGLEETCLTKKGCYDSNLENEEYFLSSTRAYCQKIRFPISPSFKVGAWIKKVEDGDSNVLIKIYNQDHGFTGKSCIINREEISPAGGEVSCDINLSTKETENYYICILQDNDNGKYKIRGNINPSEKCGYNGDPELPYDFVGAYDIFIKSKKFADIGEISITNKNFYGDDLSSLVEQYLFKEFGNEQEVNCSLGCTIPILIKAKTPQKITLSNLKVIYRKRTGETEKNSFYDVQEISPKISMEFTKLNLVPANFSAPRVEGEYNISIFLGNVKVLNKTIIVKRLQDITGITPNIGAAGIPIKLKAEIPNESLTQGYVYTWDFGDNSENLTTTTNNVEHIYENIGTYFITINVKKDNFEYSKKFKIVIGSPKDILNKTLYEKLNQTLKIENYLKSLPELERRILLEKIGIDEIKSNLSRIQQEFIQANSVDTYINLTRDIFSIRIPLEISESYLEEPFFPKKEEINPELVGAVTGGYDSNKYDELAQGIEDWIKKNLLPVISKKQYLIRYPDDEDKINFIKIHIQGNEEVYFFIKKPAEVLDNSKLEEDNYYYVLLSPTKQDVSFIIYGDLNQDNVQFFLSPDLRKIRLNNEQQPAEIKEETDWKMKALIYTLIILFSGFVLYIFIAFWYMNKYESYLFKNKVDLINIMRYITIESRKGKTDYEIENALKKAGWSNEQITYAINKFHGRNTGVPGSRVLNKILKILKRKNNHPNQPNPVPRRYY